MLANYPYYTSPAAEFIKAAFRLATGFEVVPDATMGDDRWVEIHRAEKLVVLRSGMTDSRMHHVLSRVWLHLTAPEHAPEFEVARPQLRLVRDDQHHHVPGVCECQTALSG